VNNIEAQNEERIIRILELIETLIEASHEMQIAVENGDNDTKLLLYEDILNALLHIRENGTEMEKIGQCGEGKVALSFSPKMDIVKGCDNAIYSLNNLMCRKNKVSQKIEFEFVPILRAMHELIYIYGYLLKDERRIEEFLTDAEGAVLETGPMRAEAQRTGVYKYEISIVVRAYNKLEYNKLCVETLLRNLPKDIPCEVILFNNGSSDGTKEYFESVAADKHIDIKINSYAHCINFAIEGRFRLLVSNDVLVLPNAIENMYKCMLSDEKIVRIVPTTTNVSNLQSIEEIPRKFANLDEVAKFACENNVYNPLRHEERVRLCDPIAMLAYYRLPRQIRYMGLNLCRYPGANAFPDDLQALIVRRAGYKQILAKDAFCFHFGSLTLKDEINAQKQADFYLRGREAFNEVFRVDPWGTGMCYSPTLFWDLELNNEGEVNILGVNNGFGSNPLKIKEVLKEKKQNSDVNMYLYTDSEEYLKDIKGLNDKSKLFKDWHEFKHTDEGVSFDYIVIEDGFAEFPNNMEIMAILQRRLKQGGKICILDDKRRLRTAVKKKFCVVKENRDWIIIT